MSVEILCPSSTADEKCSNADENDDDHRENRVSSLHCHVYAQITGQVGQRCIVVQIVDVNEQCAIAEESSIRPLRIEIETLADVTFAVAEQSMAKNSTVSFRVSLIKIAGGFTALCV
jgi:hypothetical protein